MHRLGNHKHYVWKRGFSGRDQFTIHVNLRVLQVICQLPIVCQNFGKTSQTLIQQIGFTSLIASLKTKETPRITIWRRYGHKRNQISSHAPISNQMFFFFFLFPSPIIPPRIFFFLFEMCGRSLRIAYSSSGRIHLYRIHVMPAEAPPTLGCFAAKDVTLWLHNICHPSTSHRTSCRLSNPWISVSPCRSGQS